MKHRPSLAARGNLSLAYGLKVFYRQRAWCSCARMLLTTQLDFVQKWIKRGWEGRSKYGMATNRSMISNASVALIINKLGSYH